MNETVVSKFRTYYWFHVAGMCIGLTFGIYTLIQMSYKKDGQLDTHSGPLLIAIVLILIAGYAVYIFFTSDLAVITVTPENIIINYLATKKQQAIDYTDIVDLSTSFVPHETKKQLKIKLSTKKIISISELEYKNYEELKSAIHHYSKLPIES